MTDLDTMKAMLERAAIEYKQEVETGGNYPGSVILTIEAGYIGFVSVLTFDKDKGSLLAIEAYE